MTNLLDEKLNPVPPLKKGDTITFPVSGEWFVKTLTKKTFVLECRSDGRKLKYTNYGGQYLLQERSANLARDLDGELLAGIHFGPNILKPLLSGDNNELTDRSHQL